MCASRTILKMQEWKYSINSIYDNKIWISTDILNWIILNSIIIIFKVLDLDLHVILPFVKGKLFRLQSEIFSKTWQIHIFKYIQDIMILGKRWLQRINHIYMKQHMEKSFKSKMTFIISKYRKYKDWHQKSISWDMVWQYNIYNGCRQVF